MSAQEFPGNYKFSLDEDSDDTETKPKKRPAKHHTPSKIKKNKSEGRFDLDLADDDIAVAIPEFRINLSKTLEMYVKEFKNSHYIGFGRRDENGEDPKYRFNLPLSLFPKIKEGIKAIDKLIKDT